MNRTPVRVLLIEDNPADVELLMLTVFRRQKDLHVVAAGSLAAAGEAAAREAFDLALLDLSLPDSRGPDTVGKARQVLGYVPAVSVREGLERTLAWEPEA